ncbi:speckle targeted PIP5K1A-regulated poly(A) polymerase [Musca domestica]|uniref:Speckle targeted PIP5K1A-regulated poly(A) polymerase n=1 Tax=Musca domestica TaxID=7370 RepID=A0A1I8N6K7_MUSDO|nr:speckle targeted PIP5K1A-regulated poly(A) polymerase [Musca domestica]
MAKDVETSTIPSTPSVATSEEEEQSNKSDTKVPKKSHAAANLNNRCSVCFQRFTTLQECLKHELLEHSLQKKNGAKNGTNVESRIKATIKSLKSQEKQEERKKVHTALVQCQKGQELMAIMKHLCMDNDSLVLIFTRIQTCLEKELRFLGSVRIFPFGSIASRLALRDADIDIFLDASEIPTRDDKKLATPQKRGAFNRISAALHRSPLFVDVFAIRNARVPIIKCKHRDTGFSIDINISCPSSMENTQFISELVQNDRRLHELLLFLKLWAKNMHIIGRANMTSYCLITMIIFYLQQPLKLPGGEHRILKSVKSLQKDCQARLVQGINYSFDLKTMANKPKIPKGFSSLDLIKGFFNFYKNYNFEDNLISPFYGRSIVKKDFNEDNYKEYSKQLVTIGQYLNGVPPEPIQLDRCMCVQDSFGLNHNVARSMLPPNKKYFIMCLENAAVICENLNKTTAGEILEKLLYETIAVANPSIEKQIVLAQNQTNAKTVANDNTGAGNGVTIESAKCLAHTMTPSKSDLNILTTSQALNTNNTMDILRSWCDHYKEAIQKMLTDFFHMELQPDSHTPQKQQRLENAQLSESWHMSASVDLWSNRFFQKTTHQTFWEYQMAQTERLHAIRRQDAKFAVQINAILSIDIAADYTSITLKITLPDGSPTSSLNKRDPLRKFFNIFRNTLQNYGLKDALDKSEEAKTTKPLDGDLTANDVKS